MNYENKLYRNWGRFHRLSNGGLRLGPIYVSWGGGHPFSLVFRPLLPEGGGRLWNIYPPTDNWPRPLARLWCRLRWGHEVRYWRQGTDRYKCRCGAEEMDGDAWQALRKNT